MRFLHTADWHLGRIFHGVHLTEDQSHVLVQFVDLVKDSKPDAIVIAGDVYDRAVPPVEAVELLNDTLSQILLDCRVPVLLIAGNHDSPERLGFADKLLAKQGLYVAGTLSAHLQPVPLYDRWGPVYFALLPYAEPVSVREALACPEADSHESAMQAMISHITRQIPEHCRKVAVSHAFVAGGEESESERPLSVGGSAAVGTGVFSAFHYTALGHLHNSQQAGQQSVRYAGSLLKYSFSEVAHKKGIALVELDGMGMANVETITLRPRREMRCIDGHLKDVLRQGEIDANHLDYLSVSLRDEQPILDAIGKLREVYPNVLQIERPYLTANGRLQGVRGDHRKMGEAELFSAFFEQMTGQPLNKEQISEMTAVMGELYHPYREEKG
jgi:exonuclease SbcD